MVSETLDELFTFRVPSTVTIQIWQVGALYKLAQLAVVLYIILTLYLNNTWAYTEVPIGTQNAWSEGGDWLSLAGSDYSNLPQCANSGGAFNYAYDGAFFNYDNAVCDKVHPYQITKKGIGVVHFTTQFIEERESAWSCDGATHTSKVAACGTSAVTRAGQQCTCSTRRVVNPVGVERMKLTFEHSFNLPEGSKFGAINGSSAIPSGSLGSIDAVLIAGNGSEVGRVPSGRAVSMSVAEWLALAGGLTLNDVNKELTADYRDSSVYPRFRTAGVHVDLTLFYHNTDPVTRKPGWESKLSWAEVRAKATTSRWAGRGPETIFDEYPTTNADGTTYMRHPHLPPPPNPR